MKPDFDILDFGEPEKENSIIKVIGVGGGGGNAVNHMYREGIHDVSFVLCNTDNQALNDSPVPVHLQLGKEGLGAGNKPEKARQAAEESIEDVKNMLSDGTKMAFITAGMGGGTGTGAAPVIARVSKEMGILTVGIVTIPFRFEGPKKIDQALDGVEEMSKHVDALLVINNERLREIYPELTVLDAFGKADDTLSVAAKSIAEIITVHGLINLDFNDVKTVLKDGGVAIMSTGYGEGEGRVKKAIDDALNSPLLNDNDVFNSKKILLSISFCSDKQSKQVAHANIAIASSNVVGKGPGNSVERDFLSQAFSDFIYAIIIEEMGIWGAFGVCLLYIILLFRTATIANRCANAFPALLIMGIALLLVTQAFFNMMVAVGLVPVTGQPLPLISRGGTSTIMNCVYIGIILSVSYTAKKKDDDDKKKVLKPALATA